MGKKKIQKKIQRSQPPLSITSQSPFSAETRKYYFDSVGRKWLLNTATRGPVMGEAEGENILDTGVVVLLIAIIAESVGGMLANEKRN